MAHAVIFNAPTASATDGLRPIDLRTDLAPLADLIEIAFADTMDSGGRAALREMRTLSKLGPGLRVLSQMNQLARGISLGYVWIADGELVGNVSVYPGTWPTRFGTTYVIANVGVHPDYRGRGIARLLMQHAMQMIAEKDGKRALLQVDADNFRARPLYRSLGFVEERTFTTWKRTSSSFVPDKPAPDVFIRRRRPSEWRQEFALAQDIRPQERGGLGWLRPVHRKFFKYGLLRNISDLINLRGVERLVVPDPQSDSLLASLWLETSFGASTRLTLLVDPPHRGTLDDVLLHNAVTRYGRSVLTIEHPDEDVVTASVLNRYRFYRQRSVVHMRWEPPTA